VLEGFLAGNGDRTILLLMGLGYHLKNESRQLVKFIKAPGPILSSVNTVECMFMG